MLGEKRFGRWGSDDRPLRFSGGRQGCFLGGYPDKCRLFRIACRRIVPLNKTGDVFDIRLVKTAHQVTGFPSRIDRLLSADHQKGDQANQQRNCQH